MVVDFNIVQGLNLASSKWNKILRKKMDKWTISEYANLIVCGGASNLYGSSNQPRGVWSESVDHGDDAPLDHRSTFNCRRIAKARTSPVTDPMSVIDRYNASSCTQLSQRPSNGFGLKSWHLAGSDSCGCPMTLTWKTGRLITYVSVQHEENERSTVAWASHRTRPTFFYAAFRI